MPSVPKNPSQKNPKISVIVPVYNVERYLGKCVESLIRQTYGNIEILLIDDGSPDRCPDICDGYARADRRIRVLHRENRGVSEARSVGLSTASGDYIMFVDGDDWIDPETCESAVSCAEKNEADVVLFPYVREFSDVSVVKSVFRGQCGKHGCLVFDEAQTKYRLHRRMIGLVGGELSRPQAADALVSACMKLYRREVTSGETFLDLRRIGSSEDALFNLRVFGRCRKAVWLDRPFYHYRKTNAASLTTVYRERLFEQWRQLFSLMKNYIDENCPEEVYYTALNNRICLSLIGLGLNETAAKNKPFLKKAERLRGILETRQYRDAYSRLDDQYFPAAWKVFFRLCERRMALPVLILLYFARAFKKAVK